MASSSSSSKVITLVSSDGETFDVDEAVAVELQTIKHMIEDGCADSAIPVPNVSGETLAKVIKYCKRHVEITRTERDGADEVLKAWDADFLSGEDVSHSSFFDLILAANYLNIKSLLDMTCQAVADMIKDKSPEEIRKTFHIKNDYTPEEEAAVRREHEWAFK